MVGMEFIGKSQDIVSARDLNLVACTRCAKVWPIETRTCGRCGHTLVSRDPLSLSRVWAWWVLPVWAGGLGVAQLWMKVRGE